MTPLQIGLVAAGIVFMLGCAIFAAAGMIENAIRNLQGSIQLEGERDRAQRERLAETELRWRAQQQRDRQTLLPPPPVLDASSRQLGQYLGRSTGRQR